MQVKEPERRRLHFPKIGMRAVKTVVAVFISCVIDFFRGVIPSQSTIAAILCIQPDTENSVQTALTRTVGTVLGGASGALLLGVFEALGVESHTIPFYVILSLLMLPLIYIPVKLGWPGATALTCVVYIVVALSYTGEVSPVWMAVNRVVDTLIGIFVALPVNVLFPNNQPPTLIEEPPGGPADAGAGGSKKKTQGEEPPEEER